MYTSYIGKKFLKLYNEENNTNYTAKAFFDEVFFELFFTDESHLMHVGNSPFFQKPKPEDMKKHGGKSLAQYANLRENIENDTPNMSIYVGAQAKDIYGNTTGQSTDMNIEVDKDDIYASWLGGALGIGVSGPFVMLIDNNEIIRTLYKGWKYYRMFLQQSPNVKDKQIETWNGQWLTYFYSPSYNENNPEDGLNIKPEIVKGKMAIPTIRWSEIVFTLSKQFPDNIITIYAYSLSHTNTTIGFINIYLHEIHEIFELRDKLFINENDTILEDHQIEKLETFYDFHSACKMGTIGLKSLEPAKLRSYMPKRTVMYAGGNEYKFNNRESFTNFQLYKLWIMAVLNKTELLNLASEIASSLLKLESKDERGKKVKETLSKEVRDSNNLKTFIDTLSKVILDVPEDRDIIKSCVEHTIKMPTDNFPLFITLVRFEYNYQKI